MGSFPRLHIAAVSEIMSRLVPKLYSFMAILSADDPETPSSERLQLLLSTVQMVTATKDGSIQDVVNWVKHRRATQGKQTSPHKH
ncbi:hypothetical protein F5Y19DRAFT_437604 [Xylariaceae sp. FL1651]|nr:hypothetical protein F5Y19DRAFT_437604 [Xylariaceae sp. FL1651]